MKRHYLARFAIVALFVGLVYCAGNPKAKAVGIYKGMDVVLSTVDDAEHVACYGVADVTTFTAAQLAHCTAGLSDADHLKAAKALQRAFDTEVKLREALAAWQPGDPTPPLLTQLAADAKVVFDVANALPLSTAQHKFLASAQAWVDTLAELVKALTARTAAAQGGAR